MPQLVHYLLLTFKTSITIPQVKYSIKNGNTAWGTYAASAANVAAELLTDQTTIVGWTAHEPGGAEIANGSLGVAGLVEEPFSDLRYALYLVLLTPTKVARNSSQYIMAYPASFLANGELSTAGAAALTAYSNELNGDPFCDSEGNSIGTVGFGHFSRRQNIRTESI